MDEQAFGEGVGPDSWKVSQVPEERLWSGTVRTRPALPLCASAEAV